MKAQELKSKFLNYFKHQEHAIIGSSSLLPENDPTVLFTTAGMHPLVPYLLGEKHPSGARLADAQKCLRTGDIEEVGDTTHHTFFEMLGNWSLGDYFKEQAIEFAWEFCTKELKLDKNKLAVTIFAGSDQVPGYDQVSEATWLKLGIKPERIAKLSDNWWGPAGQTGPCGPDTEIFYWTASEKVPEVYDLKDNRWVEIWNVVIMEYNKTADQQFIPLTQKNIDTGMGLERTLAALNHKDDNYQTELFDFIISKIEKISGHKYLENQRAFRIIADHIRSSVFVLADQNAVSPSNTGQGYVLRRLIRRAIRFAKTIGIEQNFSKILAEEIIKNKYYHTEYPELKSKQDFILTELEKEENKFRQTLEKGLKEFQKLKEINGQVAFQLFSTYGFPLELTEELAAENSIKVDKLEFEAEFKKHQDLSRTASAGMFKGGLADDSVMSRRYHTATHLLHKALKMVLGDHVEQRGSNINAERMRFDFVHGEKMTPEQIKEVEDTVNEQISKALPMSWQEMTVEEAKQAGAIGIFGDKYGEKVKVYTAGDFSKEICGGPHVENTKELGHFKITKEESSSAGIRRIKAILTSNE